MPQLVSGRSIYEFTRRLSLDPDRPSTRMWLIVATLAVAHVPLVILAMLPKLSGAEFDPLLLCMEPHARLIGSLGLLCFAEPVLDDRIAKVADGVATEGLLPPSSRERWHRAFNTFERRRDHWGFDLGWLALAYGCLLLAYLGWLPDWAARWLFSSLHGVHWTEMGPAWWWYVLVSQPLLVLALGRWLVRWALWIGLLGRLARLDLELQAVHADRVGGLGFTSIPLDSLQMFVLALGIVFASVWYDEIAADWAETSSFTVDVVVFLSLCMSMLLLPYLWFSTRLIRTREAGILEYTDLMRDYVIRFERRWLADSAAREQMLGHPDVSALIDLRSTVAAIEEMRSLIPSNKELRTVLIIAALPFVAVALAQGPATTQLLRAFMRYLGG